MKRAYTRQSKHEMRSARVRADNPPLEELIAAREVSEGVAVDITRGWGARSKSMY